MLPAGSTGLRQYQLVMTLLFGGSVSRSVSQSVCSRVNCLNLSSPIKSYYSVTIAASFLHRRVQYASTPFPTDPVRKQKICGFRFARTRRIHKYPSHSSLPSSLHPFPSSSVGFYTSLAASSASLESKHQTSKSFHNPAQL